MKITLIRHGMTAGNMLNRYCGSTDDPLSEQGLKEARAVTPDSSVKTVFVTPLIRTQQTARILFPEAEQVIVPDLREMDFGVFENRSYLDMENDSDYRAWVESGCTLPCPGGEGMEGFAQRIFKAFTALLKQNESKEALTVLAHGGTIMAIMTLFAEEQRPYYEWNVKNLEGYRMDAVLTPEGIYRLINIKPIRR